LARGKTERAKSKVATATALAALGAGIGSVVPGIGTAIGGGIGAITGLIIGDQTTVFPIDMIAIPAFQAYMINGTPAFEIFIKEGEVLTQVVPTDAQVAEAVVSKSPKRKKKSKLNPWIVFSKKFNFRAKRKNESPKEYFRLRQKACQRAYYKLHPERKPKRKK
jgi:hypothetical protein